MAVFDSDPFLKISNSPVFSQFLHECVDDLTKKTKINYNNYNSDIEWTIDDFNKARICIQNLFRQFASADKIELNAIEPTVNLCKSIKDCYEIRKNDIFQVLVEESILKSGHNLVTNIDWKLKWVMGSSKLATIREPLLQVDLLCKNNEPTRNCVTFEVNLDQLDNLIQELSLVKKEMEN